MVFLGREISEERDYGDKVAEEIDQEVKELINSAYVRACEILIEHKPDLVRIAEYLIEHEAISGDALTRLFNGEEMGDEGDTGTPATPPEPAPYAPKPAQPNISPQPAPTLSSHSAQGLGNITSELQRRLGGRNCPSGAEAGVETGTSLQIKGLYRLRYSPPLCSA